MRSLPTALAMILLTAPLHAADLTITVDGAKPGGEVRGMLFKDAASFDRRSDPLASFAITAGASPLLISIAAPPAGRYALALFEDMNGNKQLDYNLFGIPTEPTGFSNDATGSMAPPSFDQAAFAVGDANSAVTIRLH